MEAALKDFGYEMGDQTTAELLIDEWSIRNFKAIVNYCKGAEAFQDVPFSLPYTYQALDQAFPEAKFIITIRDDAEVWYRSITRFHSKIWADGERVPTSDDLRKAFYLEDGYVWRFSRLVFDTPDTDPYRKAEMLAYYDKHLANVRDYFRHRPGKLLEINIAKSGDYRRLCSFLGREITRENFPWLNKT